jgi:hypothetical protein
MLGIGERVTKPPRECRSALYEMSETTPITTNGARSHQNRVREGDLVELPGNGPP